MRSRLFLVLVSITVLFTPAFAQKRNITEKDLFNFVWIADPQVGQLVERDPLGRPKRGIVRGLVGGEHLLAKVGSLALPGHPASMRGSTP